LNQQSIRVAIDAHIFHAQHVAAGFALLPQPIPRAAIKMDLTRPLRSFQGLCIYEAQHQHFAVAAILNHRGNQAARLFERQFHQTSPQNKNPAGAVRASGLISALYLKALCRPERARPEAVMMLVSMRPMNHVHPKIHKYRLSCQPKNAHVRIEASNKLNS
jgi:hypothetical protein